MLETLSGIASPQETTSTQPVTVQPLPEAVDCALVLKRDGYVQVTMVLLIGDNCDIAFDDLKIITDKIG